MTESRIEELRRRVAQEPRSRVFAQLAEEHRKAGEHLEAVRVARSGLALHPAYPSARLTLGRALLQSGDAHGARQELQEAVRQAPESILASRFLAEALEAEGDLEGALRQYDATLRLAPGDQELVARLGNVRAKLGETRPKAAVAPAGGTGVSGEAVTGEGEGRALAARVAQRGEAARAAAEVAEDNAGREPAPFASPTLAELYLGQGFAARAIGVYRQVVAENPENDRARARLGEIEALARDGDSGGAAGRRRGLERTIGCLEALLGAARRRRA